MKSKLIFIIIQIQFLLCIAAFCNAQSTSADDSATAAEIARLKSGLGIIAAIHVNIDGTYDTISWLRTFERGFHQLDEQCIVVLGAKFSDVKKEKKTTNGNDKNSHCPTKVCIKHSDTLLFVIHRPLERDAAAEPYYYRFYIDSVANDNWLPIDFSDANQVINGYCRLKTDYSMRHFYNIEVRNKTGKKILEYSLKRPVISVLGIYTKDQKEALVNTLKYIKRIDYKNISILPKMTSSFEEFVAPIRIIDEKQSHDSAELNYRPLDMPMYVSTMSDNLLFLMKDIPGNERYEYFLSKDGVVNSYSTDNIIWTRIENGKNLIEMQNLAPGDYDLIIRNGEFKSDSVSIRLHIKSVNWLIVVKGFIAGLGLLLILFYFYRRSQKQKLKAKEARNKMISLQLQTYRSQLNPHFIFNALSSIQGMVNKNDTAEVNKYLVEFGTLLRMTLDQGKSEYWTLKDEIELLTKYIDLEQLRFRFQFVLNVDESIPVGDISFPSMLLQPMVENAIKHGISGNEEKGKLNISMKRKEDTLVINVADNGAGFDITAVAVGSHGLNLTRERIGYLNDLNNQQQIVLEIKTTSEGTSVIFYFYHYLDN